ncbi:MAG: DNA polymerase domain-containing protein [Deltaproteobacteria bacterium]
MTLWLIPSGTSRNRLRLIDRSFAPAFYVHGPEARLRQLARKIAVSAAGRAACAFTERRNIWDARPLLVLEISVRRPTEFRNLARWARHLEPYLTFYNSDLMLESLYCWEKNVFPFARVEIEINERGAETRSGFGKTESFGPESRVPNRESRGASPEISAIECRDDEWAVDYELPPLRVLRARLEGMTRVDPKHGRRGALEIALDDEGWRVLDDSDEPVACGFERLLRTHDPDLIATEWGDSTLFPGLLRQSARCGLALSLNRDPAARAIERSRARSYMSYGRILFKESATTLRGRLHVDTQNSFITDQCHLAGLWELARVTKLPVQYASRTTTGTGISYMQMELAWRDGTLIPEQKAEPESPKHPDELLRADRGGLVFPPRLGFFENVAELDFVSEFPNIMARFNVSPETVNCACCPDAPRVPELGYRICQKRRGITSRVVERLIAKRGEFKRRMKESGLGVRVSGFGEDEPSAFGPEPQAVTPPFRAAGAGLKPGATNPQPRAPRPESRIASYSLRRSSLKWLLVCCFGYTGYKNARFGKIEAHESINALAREKLLVAMHTAENAGFRILHALVDSLYVTKGSDTSREEFERLAEEIERRTGLPIAIEDVYRYVVFLPSKQSAEIPVPNRFFCVPDSGEPKVRGLECRRHDTPPIVVRMQTEVLKILSEARDYASYCTKLEDARRVLERYLARVEDGTAPAEELVISRRLTRAPGEYKQSNVTAVVARQLAQVGVKLRPGETIEYILTDTDAHLPDDRARAWTLWEGWRGYDVAKYMDALRKAFEPFDRYSAARA